MKDQSKPFWCSYCSGLPTLPTSSKDFTWSYQSVDTLFSERTCKAYDIVVIGIQTLWSAGE